MGLSSASTIPDAIVPMPEKAAETIPLFEVFESVQSCIASLIGKAGQA